MRTPLDRRYRLLSRLAPLMRSNDLSRMTDEQIVTKRLQGAPALVTGKPVPGVTWRDDDADGVGVRIYTPDGEAPRPRPIVLHLHGGGFMVGIPDQVLRICTAIADGVGAVVVDVDYRMAPEHPFPTAPEDCATALGWAHAHAADLGADPARIAVMGESAGGNLAAVLGLMAAKGDSPRISHQTLVYPALDFTLSGTSVETEGHHNLLTRPEMVFVRDKYLGDADPTDWRASPLHADDLRGQPPAHIISAEHDTLRDDAERYADALRRAGVPVRSTCFVGMVHGFVDTTFSAAIRRQALADVIAEQRLHLGVESHEGRQIVDRCGGEERA